jgi:hypothetical protein
MNVRDCQTKGDAATASLFANCMQIVKWVYAHKLVKQKFHELQKRFDCLSLMTLAIHRYYAGKWGALRKHCVTRWWSAVEVMCRLFQWKDAVTGTFVCDLQ